MIDCMYMYHWSKNQMIPTSVTNVLFYVGQSREKRHRDLQPGLEVITCKHEYAQLVWTWKFKKALLLKNGVCIQ